MVSTLNVPLGVTSTGGDVSIDLVRVASHWVMQGQTRSGKSQAEYNVLGRLAATPIVRVVGCDPSGLLLAPYAEAGEPRIALGVENLTEALEVLRWVKGESDRRIANLLRFKSDKMEDITETDPLVVLVLEEYAGLLEAAEDEDAVLARKPVDRVEPQIRRMVRQLVAQAAKAGIRVLLSTQRAEAGTLGGSSRANFGVRMSFRVDNPDSVRMLHPAASADQCELVMAHLPGVALLDAPGCGSVRVRGPVTEYRDYYARVVALRGRDHA